MRGGFLFCFLFCLFRAAPRAYGNSQARGRTGAVATGLHEIWATSVAYTTAHSKARSLTHWVGLGIKLASSWILVRFIAAEPRWGLLVMGIEFWRLLPKTSVFLGQNRSFEMNSLDNGQVKTPIAFHHWCPPLACFACVSTSRWYISALETFFTFWGLSCSRGKPLYVCLFVCFPFFFWP